MYKSVLNSESNQVWFINAAWFHIHKITTDNNIYDKTAVIADNTRKLIHPLKELRKQAQCGTNEL